MSELKRLVGLRVLATLDDGQALDGTVAGVGNDWLVLEHVTLIPPVGEHTEMDGTVFLARARVVWLQVP